MFRLLASHNSLMFGRCISLFSLNFSFAMYYYIFSIWRETQKTGTKLMLHYVYSFFYFLFFYVSLTVYLSITLANDQLDAKSFKKFITILYMYMFRAIPCSSSGGQIVLIQHLASSLSVTAQVERELLVFLSQPVHRTVTY
jgi:hypothetical protein